MGQALPCPVGETLWAEEAVALTVLLGSGVGVDSGEAVPWLLLLMLGEEVKEDCSGAVGAGDAESMGVKDGEALAEVEEEAVGIPGAPRDASPAPGEAVGRAGVAVPPPPLPLLWGTPAELEARIEGVAVREAPPAPWEGVGVRVACAGVTEVEAVAPPAAPPQLALPPAEPLLLPDTLAEGDAVAAAGVRVRVGRRGESVGDWEGKGEKEALAEAETVRVLCKGVRVPGWLDSEAEGEVLGERVLLTVGAGEEERVMEVEGEGVAWGAEGVSSADAVPPPAPLLPEAVLHMLLVGLEVVETVPPPPPRALNVGARAVRDGLEDAVGAAPVPLARAEGEGVSVSLTPAAPRDAVRAGEAEAVAPPPLGDGEDEALSQAMVCDGEALLVRESEAEALPEPVPPCASAAAVGVMPLSEEGVTVSEAMEVAEGQDEGVGLALALEEAWEALGMLDCVGGTEMEGEAAVLTVPVAPAPRLPVGVGEDPAEVVGVAVPVPPSTVPVAPTLTAAARLPLACAVRLAEVVARVEGVRDATPVRD